MSWTDVVADVQREIAGVTCLHCGSSDHLDPVMERKVITARALWLAVGVPSWTVAACSHTSGQTAGRAYFAEAIGADRIKIGWTAGKPDGRIESIRTGCPFPVRLLAHIEATQKVEGWLHRACGEAHAHNEWFHATPALREFIGVLAALPGMCR